jgi:hypothetical protein
VYVLLALFVSFCNEVEEKGRRLSVRDDIVEEHSQVGRILHKLLNKYNRE